MNQNITYNRNDVSGQTDPMKKILSAEQTKIISVNSKIN